MVYRRYDTTLATQPSASEARTRATTSLGACCPCRSACACPRLAGRPPTRRCTMPTPATALRALLGPRGDGPSTYHMGRVFRVVRDAGGQAPLDDVVRVLGKNCLARHLAMPACYVRQAVERMVSAGVLVRIGKSVQACPVKLD